MVQYVTDPELLSMDEKQTLQAVLNLVRIKLFEIAVCNGSQFGQTEQ